MTLDKMIYEVWEEVRRNIVDDDEIDKRLITELINDQRATWVENNLNKGESFGRYSQSLGTITLTVVPATYDQTTDLDRGMLVSVETIPTPIYLDGKPLFAVTPLSIDGFTFKYVDPQTVWALGSGKFNLRQIFYTLIDGHLMFLAKRSVNFELLKNIHVEVIAENPTDVTGFSSSTSTYPISGKIWTYMREQVVKALVRKIQSTEDKINNSTNDNISTRQSEA